LFSLDDWQGTLGSPTHSQWPAQLRAERVLVSWSPWLAQETFKTSLKEETFRITEIRRRWSWSTCKSITGSTYRHGSIFNIELRIIKTSPTAILFYKISLNDYMARYDGIYGPKYSTLYIGALSSFSLNIQLFIS
jgi:hypothetical protein